MITTQQQQRQHPLSPFLKFVIYQPPWGLFASLESLKNQGATDR